MFIFKNPNPCKKIVGDCVIRALSILLDLSWDTIYEELADQGHLMCDMPSSNEVWTEYLYAKNYRRSIIPDTCPYCYTISDFCDDHPNGRFLLATGSHVLTVIDGNYYDTWDSGDEIPIYYFKEGAFK